MEDSDEELERETRAAMDQKIIDDYDNKMESMIKGKRTAESLLEQHQRELKKKAKAVCKTINMHIKICNLKNK